MFLSSDSSVGAMKDLSSQLVQIAKLGLRYIKTRHFWIRNFRRFDNRKFTNGRKVQICSLLTQGRLLTLDVCEPGVALGGLAVLVEITVPFCAVFLILNLASSERY